MPLQIVPLTKSSSYMAAAAATAAAVVVAARLPSSSSAATSVSCSSPFAFAFRAPAHSSCARLLPSSSTSVYFGRGFASSSSSPIAAGATTRRVSLMTTNASSASAPASAKSIHEFTVKDIGGNEVDLSVYKGKVLLIVNVASACGLTTSNYTELAELYGNLRGKGFEVLAFPCNQFGGQEPGTNAQIKEFACTRFKAEYPIFDKIDVNGPSTAPVYQFLKSKKGGGILGDNIKWNFAKFLVDQDGNVVERYAPTTSPKKIEGDIKKLLGV